MNPTFVNLTNREASCSPDKQGSHHVPHKHRSVQGKNLFITTVIWKNNSEHNHLPSAGLHLVKMVHTQPPCLDQLECLLLRLECRVAAVPDDDDDDDDKLIPILQRLPHFSSLDRDLDRRPFRLCVRPSLSLDPPELDELAVRLRFRLRESVDTRFRFPRGLIEDTSEMKIGSRWRCSFFSREHDRERDAIDFEDVASPAYPRSGSSQSSPFGRPNDGGEISYPARVSTTACARRDPISPNTRSATHHGRTFTVSCSGTTAASSFASEPPPPHPPLLLLRHDRPAQQNWPFAFGAGKASAERRVRRKSRTLLQDARVF
ncbi:hypothetical protein BJ742DRAFT_870275 [Cladochytrium replicatum]|nr:hypothetical protein BJ742DRAFT_870275 [Cladochytrium replicatum]